MSILKATDRESVRSIAGAHVGIAAIKVQAARSGAANRTAPIVADGPNSAERTTAEAAEARQGQFKRRGKSPLQHYQCSNMSVRYLIRYRLVNGKGLDMGCLLRLPPAKGLCSVCCASHLVSCR